MLAQDSECHIVNTASGFGLVSSSGAGIYKVSKHGIVTLSETLAFELAMRGAKLKASVLCTGFVNTRIMDAERNRPPSSTAAATVGERIRAKDGVGTVVRLDEHYLAGSSRTPLALSRNAPI